MKPLHALLSFDCLSTIADYNIHIWKYIFSSSNMYWQAKLIKSLPICLHILFMAFYDLQI